MPTLRFDAATFRRLTSFTDSRLDATDPDLHAFEKAGGKLLIWHGLADPAISPVGTIAYYDAVQHEMGGRAKTRDFARLFLWPGVSHCAGGQGPDSFDGLGAVVDWDEQGHAPASLTTTQFPAGATGTPDYTAAPVATRPVYPYPSIAVDTTGGPVTQASSYTRRDPPTRFDGDVAWLASFSSGYERIGHWQGRHWVWCPPGHLAGPTIR